MGLSGRSQRWGCPNRSLVYGYNLLCCRRLMRHAVGFLKCRRLYGSNARAAIAKLKVAQPELVFRIKLLPQKLPGEFALLA